MRISIFQFFLITLLSSVAAAHAIKGQGVLDRRISIEVSNQEVKAVLKKIEKNAEVRFAYQPQLLSHMNKVSVAAENTPLSDVLRLIFHGTVQYEAVGDQIILKENARRLSAAVDGKVTDEKTGEALPGVHVTVKGTTLGTVTDADGNFSIEVENLDEVLIFSFVGYMTQEIPINSQNKLNVQLALDKKQLEEVVVVGYGSQKKTDLTGAVASVRLDDLKDAPNTNIGQFLQGTVPGLNVGVTTSSGQTPPMSIRGQVSLSGNQNVLIILDGVQYSGSLSSINPNDIESIDVLKDASSTAVYGAQAANGVILITSRKGKAGSRPRIAFRSSYTIQSPTVGNLVPRNREQYLQGIKDAHYTNAYTAESGYTQPNPSFDIKRYVDPSVRDPATGELLPNDFNWWKAGTNMGIIQENDLSMSGGSEAVTYLLSAGLVDQKGFVINDKFKRSTLRANLEVRPLNWWKIGLISSGSFVNQDGAEPTLSNLRRASPLHLPFDKTGKLIYNPFQNIELNPFVTYYVDDYERHNYYFANAYTEMDFPFLKGLSYRLNFGNNYRTDKHYYASQFDNGQTGRAYKENEQYYDYMLDNILNYKKTLGKHSFGVTLLYGAIERKYDRTYAEAVGFSRLNLSYNNLSSGAKLNTFSNAYQESLLYQMARINYKFNETYLLTATLRKDGYSAFSKANKSAIFPTLALAWILSNERFIRNIKSINQLKLRVGYGEIGNQTSRLSSLSRVTTDNSTAYIFGDGGNTAFGQQVTSLGNEKLKWERTKGLNVGLDLTLFNYKTKVTVELYDNHTSDLLYNVSVPLATGFSGIQSNIGKINNKGLEISMTQQMVSREDFNWSATLNFSANKNQIVTLTGQDLDKDGKEDDLITVGLFIGKPVGAIYNYQPTGRMYNLTEPRLPGFNVGSMSYVDQNKDGQITPDKDRVFLGRAEPAYRFSLINNLSYKGFNLTCLLNSVQGGKDGYLGISAPSAYLKEDNSIRGNDFAGLDYWSPSNLNGQYPHSISGTRSKVETQPYVSRSFVRLQDVTLSYNLASLGMLKRLRAQSINFYVSGKNLYTWTNWKGFDPESLQGDPALPVGIINSGRPVLRAFTVGLSLIY